MLPVIVAPRHQTLRRCDGVQPFTLKLSIPTPFTGIQQYKIKVNFYRFEGSIHLHLQTQEDVKTERKLQRPRLTAHLRQEKH